MDDGRLGKSLDEWIEDGWMDRRLGGWMDEWIGE